MDINNHVLSHLTRDKENIKSILASGFVYSPCSTQIWDYIFRDLNISIPDIENGMVCFTEITEDLSPITNSYMYSQFGKYGIAVDFNWAIDNGLKKVAYIKRGGKTYEALKTLIRESYPNFNHIKTQTDSRTASVIIGMLSNNPNLIGTFTDPLYQLIINMFQYLEIDTNKDEREFRIRSPKSFRGLGNGSKKEQVFLSKTIYEAKIYNNLLLIKPENVLYIFCPEEDVAFIKKDLSETIFCGINVRGY